MGKLPNRLPTNGVLVGDDDGTNITVSCDETKIFRVRKSDKQIQVPAAIDTDITL
jgi:hypothetical protein